MPAPNPTVEAVGIHGNIQLGMANANTLTNTAVKSGTFTPNLAIIQKSATTDGGYANFEPGLRSGRLEFVPRIDPFGPSNSFPYQQGDTVKFSFTVKGMWKFSGLFLIENMPQTFTVEGDATTSVSGPTKGAWTRTEDPAV